MEIKTEITELIRKNLPGEVGDVLKKRLQDADTFEATVKSQSEQIMKLQVNEQRQTVIIEGFKKLELDNDKLRIREEAVAARERGIEIAELKIQLAAEKDKTEFSKNIAMGLVRNTEYRKTIFDSENQASYMNGDNWVCPTPVNKNFTETKTQE